MEKERSHVARIVISATRVACTRTYWLCTLAVAILARDSTLLVEIHLVVDAGLDEHDGLGTSEPLRCARVQEARSPESRVQDRGRS